MAIKDMLSSWIGRLLTALNAVFSISKLVSRAASIVAHWGDWVSVGQDAGLVLCDLTSVFGGLC